MAKQERPIKSRAGSKRAQRPVDRNAAKTPADPDIKKGPALKPPPFGRRAPGTRDCRNCVIRSVRVTSGSGQPTLFDPRTAGDHGWIAVQENEPAVTLVATPDPRHCPCQWSNMEVIYVAVLTGAARRMKRRHFKMAQFQQPVTMSPRTSPYLTINNCTCTIAIRALNDDLRAGINTLHDFFQGVPLSVSIAVRCGTKQVTITIQLLDAP